MNPFAKRFEIVYEIQAADQDRASDFVRAIVNSGEKNQAHVLSSEATEQALKLFGRAYIVDHKRGDTHPVRMFDDVTHPATYRQEIAAQ